MIRRAASISLVTGLLVSGLTPIEALAQRKEDSAQRKTVRVRGKDVVLHVDPDHIFVRVRDERYGMVASVAIGQFAEAAIRAQAAVVETEVPVEAPQLADKAVIVLQAGGVVLPRVKGLSNTQVRAVAELLDTARSSEAVYKFNDRSVVLKGTITARFKQEPTAKQLAAIRQEFELRQIDEPTFTSNVVRYRSLAPGGDPFTISELLMQRDAILWAEADLVFEVKFCSGPLSPNDTFFKRQWFLQGGAGVDAPGAWGSWTPVRSTTVAVLDDGIDLQHEDLKDQLLAGFDYYESDTKPHPDAKSAHGTACAGLIAAVTNNRIGVSGLSWNARLMPLRISAGDFAADDDIAKAFEFARRNGGKVLSCSWGGGPPSNKILDAIDQCADDGCLIVAAAGNASPALDTFFPANYERCIAVGASKADNTRWGYSCYGPDDEVDLVAPSGDVDLNGDIWTTDHSGANGYNSGGPNGDEPSGNYTGRFGGTSAAAPLVAGAIAMVWSAFPALAAEEVREVIELSADKIDSAHARYVNGRNKFYGFGKLNISAAMKLAAKKAAPASNAPRTPEKESEADERIQETVTEGTTEGSSGAHPASNATAFIERLLHPRPEVYRVRGAEIHLRPVDDSVAVVFDVNSPTDIKRMTAAFNIADVDIDKWPVVSRKGDRQVVLVPKANIKSGIELRAAAKAGELPEIWPVYASEDGAIVVPLGTLTCRLSKAGDTAKVLEFAQLNGLQILQIDDAQVQLGLGPDAKFHDPFHAARALEGLASVRWAEPDLSRTLRKPDGRLQRE